MIKFQKKYYGSFFYGKDQTGGRRMKIWQRPILFTYLFCTLSILLSIYLQVSVRLCKKYKVRRILAPMGPYRGGYRQVRWKGKILLLQKTGIEIHTTESTKCHGRIWGLDMESKTLETESGDTQPHSQTRLDWRRFEEDHHLYGKKPRRIWLVEKGKKENRPVETET